MTNYVVSCVLFLSADVAVNGSVSDIPVRGRSRLNELKEAVTRSLSKETHCRDSDIMVRVCILLHVMKTHNSLAATERVPGLELLVANWKKGRGSYL